MPRSNVRKSFLFFLSFLVVSSLSAAVRRIILVVGDGMGFEQVKAGSLFVGGASGSLSFEKFPHHSQMTTSSFGGAVTDSAASATAMATGEKVANGVLSVKIPGPGKPLETLFEIAKSKGWSTGLVTTADVTDATPAAFAAHQPSRRNRNSIVQEYLTQSRPNVVFGSGKYAEEAVVSAAGYTVLRNGSDLQSVDRSLSHVWGKFGNKEALDVSASPSLADMTRVALELLEKNKRGFFLLVENEHIDEAGHNSNLDNTERTRRLVEAVKSLSEAVHIVQDWAKGGEETLVLVTADHETGGLKVVGFSTAGDIPPAAWSTSSHTPVSVPVYGWGSDSSWVNLIHDNTDIFNLKRFIK